MSESDFSVHLDRPREIHLPQEDEFKTEGEQPHKNYVGRSVGEIKQCSKLAEQAGVILQTAISGPMQVSHFDEKKLSKIKSSLNPSGNLRESRVIDAVKDLVIDVKDSKRVRPNKKE